MEFSDPSYAKDGSRDAAKTFISRKQYPYRHKYGFLSTSHPYAFHMVMTANPQGNSSIPADASGYRRFLSVDCSKVKDYEEMSSFLAEHRPQIWAEALHRYNAGERFEELPVELHEARDRAAQLKAGNWTLGQPPSSR